MIHSMLNVDVYDICGLALWERLWPPAEGDKWRRELAGVDTVGSAVMQGGKLGQKYAGQ